MINTLPIGRHTLPISSLPSYPLLRVDNLRLVRPGGIEESNLKFDKEKNLLQKDPTQKEHRNIEFLSNRQIEENKTKKPRVRRHLFIQKQNNHEALANSLGFRPAGGAIRLG